MISKVEAIYQLLINVFQDFRNMCLETYKLDPVFFLWKQDKLGEQSQNIRKDK